MLNPSFQITEKNVLCRFTLYQKSRCAAIKSRQFYPAKVILIMGSQRIRFCFQYHISAKTMIY